MGRDLKSSRRCLHECQEESSGEGGGAAGIDQYLDRLTPGAKNIDFSDFFPLAAISVHDYPSFKAKLYLSWSVSLSNKKAREGLKKKKKGKVVLMLESPFTASSSRIKS